MKKLFLSIIIASSLLLCGCESKEDIEKYEHGISLIEQKEWERATNTFNELGDFRDSKDKLKEIVYLENTEILDSHLENPALYEDDLKSAINKLIDLKNYKKLNTKIQEYINTMEKYIDSEKEVKNSEQKDYSNKTFSYFDILRSISYDKEYQNELNPYLCSFTKQALTEGFYTYSFTSALKTVCDDTEGIENNKYFKMVSKSWHKIIDKNKYSSNSHFIQFLTNNVMTYEDTYISVFGQVPLKYSYWYKIYDGKILVKENKNDKFKKKFTISSVDDKSLKLKEIKKSLDVM